MNLTRQERETIIDFNEAEGVAHIHTMSAPVWRDLERKGFKAIEVHGEGKPYGKEFEIPKHLVSLRRPRARMSAEQRAKAAGQLARIRKKQGTLPLFS
jgi:hypothetical protein